MKRFGSAFLICCLISLYQIGLYSQNEVNELVNLSGELNLVEIFNQIEEQSEFRFSYNPAQIPLESSINFEDKSYLLQDVLQMLSNRFKFKFDVDLKNKKILVIPIGEYKFQIVLLDSLSNESVIGALVVAEDQYLASSNENGYISFSVPSDKKQLLIYNIGYEPKIIDLTADTIPELVLMSPRLSLDVVITDSQYLFPKTGSRINVEDIEYHFGTAGSHDLIQNLKFLPGVSNGAEGQNGYSVRGGGPNQNQIIIDGMPIYEASHLGGMSSVFLPQSIKDVNFFKSGQPAKYGGRLSSILDVKLDDGNRKKFDRLVSVGLEGPILHVDGPLTLSTTINLNLRSSWFSQVVSPLVKRYTNVDDLVLQYNDAYLKLSHWFSETNKLSLSAYSGSDEVKFSRVSADSLGGGFRDFNALEWGNNFVSLNWDILLNSQMFMHFKAGRTEYNYKSRGSYEISYPAQDSFSSASFDIYSVSELTDYIARLELDHSAGSLGQFTYGFDYIYHNNDPIIKESETFASNTEPPVDIVTDTLYKASELNAFVQHEIDISERVLLQTGLRWSNFFTPDKSYSYLEPRIKLEWHGQDMNISMSYARMSQFIHLLSNPGPGIPSDLWVPSTAKVAPELSGNLSLDLFWRKEKLSGSFSVWRKSFSNLIEYSNPSDLIYSLIINNQLYQVEVDNGNWEDRVSFGTGHAYGFETSIHYSTEKWVFDLNYGFSRSWRVFDDFDDGEAFPYKFDSPHSISSMLRFKLSASANFVVNFQYATGTAYSLSDNESLGPDGKPILVPSSRNNFRLPAYHHLDIHYTKTKQWESGFLKFDVGLYNVYNRQNAFYEYLKQDSELSKPELVKISIFPILPQFSLSYSW